MSTSDLEKRLVDTLATLLCDPYSPLYKPKYLLQIDASASSIRYIKKHAANAMLFENRFEVLEFALKKIRNEKTLFLEFGVYKGKTINFIAERIETRTIHGFDSFEGLPEDWKGYIGQKGDFNFGGLPDVAENVNLHKGWFDDSLPEFLSTNSGDVAFLHIDSDLYSSADTILSLLESRLSEGSIIVFDEYLNYPNWKNHEYKAFQEFIQRTEFGYEYIAVGHHQVAVVLI